VRDVFRRAALRGLKLGLVTGTMGIFVALVLVAWGGEIPLFWLLWFSFYLGGGAVFAILEVGR
jgi:hypothetical protein